MGGSRGWRLRLGRRCVGLGLVMWCDSCGGGFVTYGSMVVVAWRYGEIGLFNSDVPRLMR